MQLTLRERRGGGADGPATTPRAGRFAAEATAFRRELRCAACGHPITSRDARVERAGSSSHTFVNPHGLVFGISCFAAAPGAVAVGPSSSEWTWFSGYAWQVQLCGGCRTHIGWLFIAPRDRFCGLIDERLVESDDAP